MPAKEVSGTISTFGEQVLSSKPTKPKYSFGSSGRTEKIYDKEFTTRNLGKGSPGAAYKCASSIGQQQLSKKTNAPAHRFGNRYGSDVTLKKEARPGPGVYGVELALGKQTLSKRKNTPSWKFGQSGRWSHYANNFKDQYKTPAAGTTRMPKGELGDGPGFSFHGKGERADVGKGLPGCKPTFLEDPGPGSYTNHSSFGQQFEGKKPSMPRPRLGTAKKEANTKQYLSAAHERSLYGTHSPAPSLYNPGTSIGAQVNSKKKSSSNMKFGSSDRFSDVKSRNAKQSQMTPGPGSYVV